MDGRWTLHGFGPGYLVSTTDPKNLPPGEWPVVPCDDEAVERGAAALVKIAARWGMGEWQMSGARELAAEVLRAAGELHVSADNRPSAT